MRPKDSAMASSGAFCITTRNQGMKQQASAAVALNTSCCENCCTNDAFNTLGMFGWMKAKRGSRTALCIAI